MKRLRMVLMTCFLAVFSLSLFNRELSLAGIDLRFVVMALGGALLAWSVHERLFVRRRPLVAGADWALLGFLVLAIGSNVAWLWNGLTLRPEVLQVVLISCCYNLFVYIVVLSNRQLLRWRLIAPLLLTSATILAISVIAAYYGADLRQFGSAYSGGYIDKLSGSLISSVRYGGYAQDPNYASLFVMIGVAIAVYQYVRSGHWYRGLMQLLPVPLLLFALLLSASKSVLLMAPVALVLALIGARWFGQLAKVGLIVAVFVGTIGLAVLQPRTGVQTLDTRIDLWHTAVSAVPRSPLIGNGLTAARSSIADDKWYVQPHSSVIQIIVDTGILGLLLIGFVMSRHVLRGNRLVVFVTLLFLANFATHETIYQTYFVFCLGLLPLMMRSPDVQAHKKAVTVFVVNTLSNGGAERVVQNMANNAYPGEPVVIYTLHDTTTPAYTLKKGVKVVPLGGSGSRSPLEAWRLSRRLNRCLGRLTRQYRLRLATAHLPFAHLVVRLSRYGDDFLYVMHGMSGVRHTGLQGLIVRVLYAGRQLISVSKGLERGDLRGKYGIKTGRCRTIYNPIDFSLIDAQLKSNVRRKKQILYVGRFAEPKNPLAALHAFRMSGLAKHGFVLTMLGDGPLRPQLERYIHRHGLQRSVVLEGFVTNPFSYMQESAMLVIASDYEAFTMVACEALYCECPVVAYNINYGIDEVLTDDLAPYIAKRGDVHDMARVMALAAVSYPSELRKRIVPMVAPKVVMKQYYQTYKEWN